MAWTLPSGSSSPISRSLSETASVSLIETASGSHLFKVANYSLQQGIGIGKHIRSKTFAVGGHQWAIDCYPDGDRKDDKSANVSAFLYLHSEATDVRVMFNLSLLDQNGERSTEANYDLTYIFPSGKMGYGMQIFIKKDKLETSKCLIDDCFTIKCELQVIKASRTEETKINYIAVPPSNLHEHLGHLLESGKGADVTFIVDGESFAAHTSVLAARSPVFDAELFGSMREGRTQCIVIDDMEARVFKALLHFIYTDTLPKMEELIGESTKEGTAMITKRLLVAADRYELKRLRLLCEHKLCERMDISTLATTLLLAEQHHCEQLKAICLEFMADRRTRLAVMATEGFKHLMEGCTPLLLKDLLEKL